MNKLQIVQNIILTEVRRVGVCSIDDEKLQEAWNIADKMQAEADKRENKDKCSHDWNETTSNGDKYRSFVCAHCDATRNFEPIEEWQPDWSQAPDWANWWTFDNASPYWWSDKPLKTMYDSWYCNDVYWKCEEAPSFGYTGDWRKSLRKRPQ